MRRPIAAASLPSTVLALLSLTAWAEDAKPAATPVAAPVEVASVESARALDAGVTRVHLAPGTGDEVLVELAPLKGLTLLSAPDTAVTDQALRALSGAGTLHEIDLSRCPGITAAGLKALGGLRKLEVLRLAGLKALDDAALAPLGKLPKLRVLDLSECSGLGDGSIKALRELEAIEELDLSGVPLTQLGTVHLVRLRSLRVLKLDRTGIPDQSMLEIVALRNLESLSVSGNTAFGYIGLLHLDGLRKLRTLVASGLPDLSDEALQRAAKMTTLETLDVSNCRGIGDSGVSALAMSPALKSLNLSQTRVTGAGVLALAKSKSLRSLRIAGCPGVSAKDLEAARAAMPSVAIRSE